MAIKNVLIKQWNGSTYDDIYPKTIADNIISGVLADARIPNLNASKINAGTFDDARIPNLNASKITAGTLDTARIPNLDASKITSGEIDVARLPAIAITNVEVVAVWSAFLTLYAGLAPGSYQVGDMVIASDVNRAYIHNGGTSMTASDFNLLSTPTAAVISVAGKTGAVTLVKGDVGLGNVDNTSDANKPVSTAQAAAINAKVTANTAITAGTKTKITYDAKGLVTAGADLVASDIPSLDVSKITSGIFNVARIPDLAISKITGLTGELSSKSPLIQTMAEALLSSLTPVINQVVFVT